MRIFQNLRYKALALGGWPIRRFFVALLAWSILVNAFGAVTFKRMSPVYYGNASARTMYPTE